MSFLKHKAPPRRSKIPMQLLRKVRRAIECTERMPCCVLEEPPTINSKDIWHVDEVPDSGTKIADQMDRRPQPEYENTNPTSRCYLHFSLSLSRPGLDMKCTTSNASPQRICFSKWVTRILPRPAARISWYVHVFHHTFAEHHS